MSESTRWLRASSCIAGLTVDPFVRAAGGLHLPVCELAESLESESKGPHDFAVAHDDAPPIGALPIEVGQHAVDARQHVDERLAAGRRVEQRVTIATTSLLAEANHALLLTHWTTGEKKKQTERWNQSLLQAACLPPVRVRGCSSLCVCVLSD